MKPFTKRPFFRGFVLIFGSFALFFLLNVGLGFLLKMGVIRDSPEFEAFYARFLSTGVKVWGVSSLMGFGIWVWGARSVFIPKWMRNSKN
jgi:hypothetical protein